MRGWKLKNLVRMERELPFLKSYNMFEMHRYETELSESNTLAEATVWYNFDT